MFLRFIVSLSVCLGFVASPWAQSAPIDTRSIVQVLYLTSAPNGACSGAVVDGRYIPVGSGTIVTAGGLVLTNEHVYNLAADAVETCRLDTSVAYIGYDHDQDRHTPVRVLYRATKLANWYSGFPAEPDYDVAVMEISHSATGSRLGPQSFPYLRLGNPFDLPDRAEITFLGFPGVGGQNMAFTTGQFSHYLSQDSDQMTVDGALFINADIWGGNSGGAALHWNASARVWELVGIPTMGRSDGVALVHPITWASPLFHFVRQKLNRTTPSVPTAWARSPRNADPWTRERSTVMGYVRDQSGQPVSDARVFVYPSSSSLESVRGDFSRQGSRVPNVSTRGLDLVYSVAQTGPDGFFETWIDADQSFRVHVEKSGYTFSAGPSWTPAQGLSQQFTDPFVLNRSHVASDQRLHVTNSCSSAIKMAVRYRNERGAWENKAWWTLESGAQTYLNSHDNRSFQSTGGQFYYFAESTDGRWVWKGETVSVVGERRLEMRTQVGTRLTVTCDE